MIDINKLFDTHSNCTSLNEGHYEYMLDKDDFKQALKEYTELLLKEVADKAQLSLKTYVNCDFTKEEDYGQEVTTEREDEYWTVSKSSITSIINDINFD